METKSKKKDISSKNPALQRLVRFLEPKGRLSAIAKNIEMSENIFSNMIMRDTKPSSELLISLSSLYPDMDIHYILTGSELGEVKRLREEVKAKDSEIAYNKAIITKFAMPGKTEGASSHPQVDREGFSEVLIKGIRKNMKRNNISLLSNSWKLTNPN